MKLMNIIKHFNLITHHKWVVFKLCCKIGEPWRGFWHDMSKYSPTEFWENVKYYNGTHSPIIEAKKDKGYSEAWLHHKGRNKHHLQYWVDETAPEQTPILPYEYAVELICDRIAAGIIYDGKNWTQDEPLNYWRKERPKLKVNYKIEYFITKVFGEVAEYGIDKTLTEKNLKKIYAECTR